MTTARTVLGLCRQFHVLPSQVLAEDVELMRMLAIEDRGTAREETGGG